MVLVDMSGLMSNGHGSSLLRQVFDGVFLGRSGDEEKNYERLQHPKKTRAAG